MRGFIVKYEETPNKLRINWNKSVNNTNDLDAKSNKITNPHVKPTNIKRIAQIYESDWEDCEKTLSAGGLTEEWATTIVDVVDVLPEIVSINDRYIVTSSKFQIVKWDGNQWLNDENLGAVAVGASIYSTEKSKFYDYDAYTNLWTEQPDTKTININEAGTAPWNQNIFNGGIISDNQWYRGGFEAPYLFLNGILTKKAGDSGTNSEFTSSITRQMLIGDKIKHYSKLITVLDNKCSVDTYVRGLLHGINLEIPLIETSAIETIGTMESEVTGNDLHLVGGDGKQTEVTNISYLHIYYQNTDTLTIYNMYYYKKDVNSFPIALEGWDESIEENWFNMNRNLYDDFGTYLNDTHSIDIADGEYIILGVAIYYDNHIDGTTDSYISVCTSELTITLDSIEITGTGGGIVYDYDISSDAIKTSEASLPYLEPAILTDIPTDHKLIHYDYQSEYNTNLHREILYINISENKWIIRIKGKFMLETDDPESVTNIPKVKMLINAINYKTYKESKNIKWGTI